MENNPATGPVDSLSAYDRFRDWLNLRPRWQQLGISALMIAGVFATVDGLEWVVWRIIVGR